jgi:hypothetical protein
VGCRSAKCSEGKGIKVGGMWSVYKGSEVEWGVGLGTMCVIEYCIVWFIQCLVYLVVFNTDSSTLGSTHFCGLIVYNMCSCLLLVISCVEGFLECCMLFCVICVIVIYCIVLYCTVLYCPVLHCSTLQPSVNPFEVDDDGWWWWKW